MSSRTSVPSVSAADFRILNSDNNTYADCNNDSFCRHQHEHSNSDNSSKWKTIKSSKETAARHGTKNAHKGKTQQLTLSPRQTDVIDTYVR